MRWQRGPLESGDFGENGVFGKNGRNGDNRQNRQIVNKNSNEMAKGHFGKWRFWRKWRIYKRERVFVKANQTKFHDPQLVH